MEKRLTQSLHIWSNFNPAPHLSKLQPLGYSNMPELKLSVYSLLSGKIKFLFALFRLFLAGNKTGCQVKGSESKFDISYFTQTIRAQLPVKKIYLLRFPVLRLQVRKDISEHLSRKASISIKKRFLIRLHTSTFVYVCLVTRLPSSTSVYTCLVTPYIRLHSSSDSPQRRSIKIETKLIFLLVTFYVWVVLVHDTRSNDSRSNDARFIHKLRKHAFFIQR